MTNILCNMFVENHPLTLTLLFIVRTLSIIGVLIPIIDLIMLINEKSSRRFHAAEHMSINAYQKLGRAPSLEEIKRFSRLTNFCGTNTYAKKSVYFLLIFVFSFISNPFIMWIVTIIICSETLIHLLSTLGFFNIFQFLTTSKPTDTELKVAIIGLKSWIENEPKIENPEEVTLICISKTFFR